MARRPPPPVVGHVLDLLADLDPEARPMFGGHGLYLYGQVLVGLLDAEALYLRVDDSSRPQYEARGVGPFRPGGRTTLAGYHEVPPEVLAERELLVGWVLRAAEVVRAERSRG